VSETPPGRSHVLPQFRAEVRSQSDGPALVYARKAQEILGGAWGYITVALQYLAREATPHLGPCVSVVFSGTNQLRRFGGTIRRAGG